MLARTVSLEARIVSRPDKSRRWTCGDRGHVRPWSSMRHATQNGLSEGYKRPNTPSRTGTAIQCAAYHDDAVQIRKVPSNGNPSRRRSAHVSLVEPEQRIWRAVRQTRQKGVEAKGRAPRLWRHISTTASIEDLEGLFEQDGAAVETDQAPRILPEVQHMLDKISAALKEGASDWLLKILTPVLLENKTMAYIADDTFTAMLSLWCSKDYFEDMISHHLAISETDARNLRIAPVQSIIEEYLSVVTNVAHMRRKAGCRLSTDQYGQLLAAAHNTGSTTISQLYWNWMLEDSAKPDVDCYAHYLGAQVWNDLLPPYRERSHLIPFNTVAREHPYAGKPFDNYKVRLGGIKQTVTDIYAGVTKARIAPNEAVICHVLTGLAREGDTRSMTRLLQRTWGVNVSSIMADDDTPPSHSLKTEHALHPTDQLLTTLAFGYGINSSLPTALRVIDYISRHFGLAPSQNVWSLLLTWAYVLSRPRKASSEFQPPLDPAAVLGVWDTMLGPPYNILPSMDMYDKLVRTLARQQRAADVVAVMRAGFEARSMDMQALREAEARLEEVMEGGGKGEAERAQRAVEMRLLQVKRGARYLKTWARLLLGMTRDVARLPEPGERAEEVLYRAVPGMLGGEWAGFVGRRVRYTLPTGLVEIEVVDEGQVVGMHERLYREAGRRKALMDKSIRAVGHEWVVKRFESRRLRTMGGVGGE